MNNLKIVEQKIGQDLIQSVSARDLHKGLESKEDFSKWMPRYLAKFDDGVDWIITAVDGGNPENIDAGRPITKDYAISLDMAKHIAMLSETVKGKEIRQYFIECEKKLNQPKSMAEIALMHSQLLVKLEREQKLISEKQDALEIEVKKVVAKQSAFEEGLSYFTVLGYAAYRGVTIDLSLAQKIGKDASALSKEKDIPIDRTKDARFGMVNSYHEKILDEVIAGML